MVDTAFVVAVAIFLSFVTLSVNLLSSALSIVLKSTADDEDSFLSCASSYRRFLVLLELP